MPGRLRGLLLVGSLAVVGALITGCGPAKTDSAQPGVTVSVPDTSPSPSASPLPSTSGQTARYAAPTGTLCDHLDLAAIKAAYPSTGVPTPAPTPSGAADPALYRCTVTVGGGTGSPATATLTIEARILADAKAAEQTWNDEQAGYALNNAGNDVEGLAAQATYYDTPVGRILYVSDGNLYLSLQLSPNPKTAAVDDAAQQLLVAQGRALLAGLREQ